jgi:hypothetical protein
MYFNTLSSIPKNSIINDNLWWRVREIAEKTGIVESKYRKYEVHWYEYEGKQYESKIKGIKVK